DIRGRLAGLMLSPASPLDPERANQLAELTREKEQLERELKATAARTLLASPSATLEDLISRLPQQAAFVDFFRYDRLSPAERNDAIGPAYLAFVVRHNRRPVAVDLGAAGPIDEALGKWVAAILAEHREDAADTIQRLVWKPLAPHLPTGPGATLYIA